MDEILGDLIPVMKKEFPRRPPSNENLYEYYLTRVRNNLHVVLCFSPVSHMIFAYVFIVTFTVKPVFSDHIKQDLFWGFQTGGCLLLHESSAESSCMSFLYFFHSAISNHLSILMSVSPE